MVAKRASPADLRGDHDLLAPVDVAPEELF